MSSVLLSVDAKYIKKAIKYLPGVSMYIHLQLELRKNIKKSPQDIFHYIEFADRI